jgi:hypothetical protein
MAQARATRLMWEVQNAGVSADVATANLDKEIAATVGQIVIDANNQEMLMVIAEELGWVMRVPDEQAQSADAKRFLGDVSLSPAPRPPPPPPPIIVIAKTAGKRVFTKVAPVALVTSQVDGPLPGGDAIALGMLAVAAIAVGAITVYDIVTAPENEPTTTAVPAPASVAQPNATPAPAVKPRKYPNQTCEDDERERLQAEKKKICDLKGGYAASCTGKSLKDKEKLAKIPCSLIKLSLQQRRACMAARWVVQDKCFGGKPDPEHEGAIDQVQNGINNCEALEPINCAKGHPMANL